MSTTKNLRRVKAISKILDMDNFYSVDAGRYNITLQGEYDRDLVKAAIKNKFEFVELADNGFVHLVRGNITINLG
jgi:hypothetical protein